MSVTVLTPSLPEREAFRRECVASVAGQDVDAHLLAIDHARAGIAATLNLLWPGASSEWLAVLADDDLLDPDYFETVFAAPADAEVYYTWCRVVGHPDGWSPNQRFDEQQLRRGNFIPATAVIRRSLVVELGGWREHPEALGLEDWDFWLRALDVGARFCCIERAKWTFRFHGSNLSLVPLSARRTATDMGDRVF